MTNTSKKYNIILTILLFIIPILAFNISYYYTSKINEYFEIKEQEKKAMHEAETLASEGDFKNQISSLFSKFFDTFRNDVKLNYKDKSFIVKHIKKSADKIFEEPFPQDYFLYTFKIDSQTKKTNLIFTNDNKNLIGKTAICKAFEQLYKINYYNYTSLDDLNVNKNFVKQLIGKFTSPESIAKAMRGLPTHTNGVHKASWFIWDYVFIEGKGTFGVIFLYKVDKTNQEIAERLALKNLKKRFKGLGAFIPLYKGDGNSNIFGKPILQYPLDKSTLFSEWASKITIHDLQVANKWLENSLPQGDELGNYTAYQFLARGSFRIAVVLVKSIKTKTLPKWLILFDFIDVYILFIIIYCYIFFDFNFKFSLKIRFAISYMLASFLPLSILLATAYAYILEYQKTSINKELSEIQTNLKSTDAKKMNNVREYKATFTNVLNEKKLIDLIKEKGIEDESAARYVLDKFESEDSKKSLPILGVKILDENGRGALVEGRYSKSIKTNINLNEKRIENIDSNFKKTNKKIISSTNTEIIINALLVTQIDILREKIASETPNIKFEKEIDELEEIEIEIGKTVNKCYDSMSEVSLKDEFQQNFSVPVSVKKGSLCIYQLFDLIKIDGKIKYILLIIWEDKYLDDRIIKESFNYYSSKNKNQNFIAYRIDGQNIKTIGDKTRHATKEFLNKLPDLAKQTFYLKKTDTFSIDDNLVVFIPSLNFSNTVFVGWVDKFDITFNVIIRKYFFIILILISLFIIYICSIRAANVFVKPVSELKKALDEVAIGNLNISLQSIPQNEFGNLSNEFSNMIDGLKEKDRISKLLSDQAIVALEKKSNGLLNDTETFEGVALVSDIRNFTGMTEKYDPTIITDLLNNHFAEMAKIISENGGQIYKFIGDAIEAIFPEKDNLEKASYRAFKASCRMITKLAFVNAKRKRKGLFVYKIGVGLSYGTMYSGTVGSIDSRLDYAILGEPLKKAAKLEALSIQNPSFPLVTDELISKRMSENGIGFKKLDTDLFSAYTVEEIGNLSNLSKSLNIFSNNKEKENTTNQNKSNNTKVFLLQKSVTKFNVIWQYLLNFIAVISVIFLISFGINFIYSTYSENLKSQSIKECTRLFEQINSDEALKSALNIQCLDFSEKIRKKINFNDSKGKIEEAINSIREEYDKLGCPIPLYCCKINYNYYSRNLLPYKFNNFEDVFSDRTFNSFKQTNNTIFDGNFLRIFLDKVNNNKKVSGYDFLCGFPVDITTLKDKINIPKFITFNAGKDIFLALNKGDDWVFSNGCSQKEINFIKSNIENKKILDNFGFISEIATIYNDNTYNKWKVFIIKKNLFYLHLIYEKFKVLIPLSLSFFFIIILCFANKKKNLFESSISLKLSFDILLSAFMPILIVLFLSILYVIEDYNIKKSETLFEMNTRIDELERKELYYLPFYNLWLNIKSESPRIMLRIKQRDIIGQFKYLQHITKNGFLKVENQNNQSNKTANKDYHKILELLLVAKNDFVASGNDSNGYNLDFFGRIFSDYIKYIFFSSDDSNSDNYNSKNYKREEIFRML